MSADKRKMHRQAVELCRSINRDRYSIDTKWGRGRRIYGPRSARTIRRGALTLKNPVVIYCLKHGLAVVKRVHAYGWSGRAGNNFFIVTTGAVE